MLIAGGYYNQVFLGGVLEVFSHSYEPIATNGAMRPKTFDNYYVDRWRWLKSCQLFVMTYELLRQTDHSITTHTPTQVITAAVDLIS